MSKPIRILFFILLVPILLLVFTVVHEEGHTILARMFGDPDATFSLVEIRSSTSFCLGCNMTDHTRLSYVGNVFVSAGGILFSQAVAIAALAMLRRGRGGSLRTRVLQIVILIFGFMDMLVQVLQGLAIDFSRRTYPTNTDLTDFLLLISSATGASQVALKTSLAIVTGAYLIAIYRLGWQKRNPGRAVEAERA